MKKHVLILTILTAQLLCACTPSTAEAQPPETALLFEATLAPETTLPEETTVPLETAGPADSLEDFSQYYELLDFTVPERNWINAAIGCVFSSPEEIDLNYMFYLGTEGGSWQDISSESEQALIDQGFTRNLDLQVMPVEDIENILQTTFGISLSDVSIPEEWGYIEPENSYCSNHNDAYFVLPSAITTVSESDDGIVAIFYTVNGYHNTQTDEFLDSANLVLTLQKTENNGWLVLSNVIA